MRKERPILFRTVMVQAILSGRKTQTRRLIKKVWKGCEIRELPNSLGTYAAHIPGRPDIIDWKEDSFKCPFGKVGDILWVRETFTQNGLGYYRYKANFNDGKGKFTGDSVPIKYRNKWLPSLFMPKEACRIWLEIISIKVEKLNSISETDALSEGVEIIQNDIRGQLYRDYKQKSIGHVTAINSFESLWCSINGQQSWANDPWLWVIEFKIIDKPSDY